MSRRRSVTPTHSRQARPPQRPAPAGQRRGEIQAQAQKRPASAPTGATPAAPLAVAAGAPARRVGRAQSMVEFALITPLLFILIFGIIEFAWLFKTHMNLYYAAREGARMGVVVPNAGDSDDEILTVISTTMATMPHGDWVRVHIYRANASGDCADNPCEEDVYEPDNAQGWNLTPVIHTWPPGGAPSARRDVEPTDVLGIKIEYDHHFLINFLPGALGHVPIEDHVAMQIEPILFGTPTPGPSPTPTP